MNYLIKDIIGPKDGNGLPSAEGKTFLSETPEKYLEVAKKVIKYFSPLLNIPTYKVGEMLSGEDYISEVATAMMLADLTYDVNKARGKTPRSWRNYRGKKAIQDCLEVCNNKKNRTYRSLNAKIGHTSADHSREITLLDMHPDLIEEPNKIVESVDRRERVRKYVKFLLENSDLTDLQRQCINLRFFGGPRGSGISSLDKVGKLLNPPTTRQNVLQIIDRALNNMRTVALGTTK